MINTRARPGPPKVTDFYHDADEDVYIVEASFK